MSTIVDKRHNFFNNSGNAVIRVGYDLSNYTDITPDSAGKLTFDRGIEIEGELTAESITVDGVSPSGDVALQAGAQIIWAGDAILERASADTLSTPDVLQVLGGLENTVIGATTPAAGTFTDLNATDYNLAAGDFSGIDIGTTGAPAGDIYGVDLSLSGALTLGTKIQGPTSLGYLPIYGDSGASVPFLVNDDGSVSVGGTPAQSGNVRLANNEYITARDSGNSADKRLIGINNSNNVLLDLDAAGASFFGTLGVLSRMGVGSGSAVLSGASLNVAGSLSGQFVNGLRVGPSLTVDTGSGAGRQVLVDGGIITIAASVAATRVVGLEIDEPDITLNSGASVTDAVTVYIKAAPTEGTNNYALWVDAGLNRFDGDGSHVFELPADATDPTGGGGAATGRIPVTIGGVTLYIAYY